MLVSRCGTVPTVISYTLDIYEKFYDCVKKANGDREKLKQLLLEKKYFFILKFSEYPVSPLLIMLNSFAFVF